MKRYLLYGLIGIAIVGTVAFGFRQEIFRYLITPSDDFAAYAPPAPPDYASEDAWAALPDREDNADLVPPGTNARDMQATAAVDVFYIHPTTNYQGDAWNAAIDDPGVNRITDNGTLKHQASAFNGCCRIYAPRYRQATLASFLDEARNGAQALALAYEDVLAAFQYYLTHYNDGRPFILASHSQGTRHAINLMQNEIDRTPVADRLVAAYLIGFPHGLRADGKVFEQFFLCQSADQTGCVLAWNSFVEGGDPSGFRAGTDLNAGIGKAAPTEDSRIACVNPLSWKVGNDRAGRELHLGAIPFDRDSESGIAQPRAHLFDAWCKNGFLYVSEPGEGFTILRLPGGNFHNYDYNLFYMNIRKNAALRAAAFLANRSAQ